MTVARWKPTSEKHIKANIDDGSLEESHFIDAKREVGSTKGSRKETARDLASFAIDGGTLLIGVDEDKPNRTWDLAPQPLVGLSERIEQIASNLVDPPLFLRVDEIVSEADSAVGYLLVEVPASPAAPHMVDGIYYGRGEKTKQRLSDPEVHRLHLARQNLESRIDRLLDGEIERDPIHPDRREHGHLFLVAHPVSAAGRMARSFVRGDSQAVYDLIQSAEAHLPRDIRDFDPTPGLAGALVSRANGVARCSESLRAGREFRPDSTSAERRMIDIELREDGGIRVLLGRMTDLRQRPHGDSYKVILDGLAVGYCARLIQWAAAMGETCEYRGSWGFGVAAEGLRGLTSDSTNFAEEGPHFDQDGYHESTIATYFEMKERPHEVLERLIGPLIRGLGTYQRFSYHLS